MDLYFRKTQTHPLAARIPPSSAVTYAGLLPFSVGRLNPSPLFVHAHAVGRLAEEHQQAQGRVAKLEGERDKAVDRIFKAFCKSIGIANIREYEGKELRVAQERAKKKLDFLNVESRLKNQIDYERSRDTAAALKAAKEVCVPVCVCVVS